MDDGTKNLVGIGVGGTALSVIVLYNYPQKYWIPWLLVLEGCFATVGFTGLYLSNS